MQGKVPDSGRLLEAIESLFQLPNFVGMILVYKSRRLLHVNVAVDGTVQKRGIDMSKDSTACPLLAAIESISLRLGAAITGL